MIVVGIDPGKSGGIAWMHSGHPSSAMCQAIMPDATSITEQMYRLHPRKTCDDEMTTEVFVALESVSSRPGEGVVSVATFMRHFGNIEGVLVGMNLRHILVLPRKWQQYVGVFGKRHDSVTQKKNAHKARAKQSWPNLKVTHSTADAILIMEWALHHVKDGGLL